MPERIKKYMRRTAIAVALAAVAGGALHEASNDSDAPQEIAGVEAILKKEMPHYAGALLIYKENAKKPAMMVIDPKATPKAGVKRPDPDNPKDWDYFYTSATEPSGPDGKARVILAKVPKDFRLELRKIPGQSGDIESTRLKSFAVFDPKTGGQDTQAFEQGLSNVRRVLPRDFLAGNDVSNRPTRFTDQVSARPSLLTRVILYNADEKINKFPQDMVATPIELTYSGEFQPDVTPIMAPRSG